MIIDKDTENAAKIMIYDARGTPVPFVESFNTETGDMTVYLHGIYTNDKTNKAEKRILLTEEDGPEFRLQPIKVSFRLKGSYARVDGKLIGKDGKIIEEGEKSSSQGSEEPKPKQKKKRTRKKKARKAAETSK